MKPGEQPYTDAPDEVIAAMGGRPPTVQQWEAISHDLTPCAVIAGAGSGKTAVMAARVVYLTITKAALPSQILCLTFTNKAAEELSNRVRNATAALGLPEGEEATVATYHSFSARLLDDYGLRMRIEAGPMLMTAAHKWQLASALFADRTFEHLEVRTVPYTVRRVLDLAEQCADHLIDPLELAERSERFGETLVPKTRWDHDEKRAQFGRAELARLVHAYSERKREMGLIDFGDQIALACRLVNEYPEVVTDFRARFPIVLLDEFQDTNHAQARLLGTLCGRDYPVMSVGDPDQNIYAWRGASLRNILRFAEDFGGEHKPLYVNFRSGSRILQVANCVIDKVPAERRGEDKELRPHPSRGDGRVLAFVGTDERDEARRIAEHIAAEHDAGRAYSDVAVLCRKKKLFPAIAEELRAAGIPVEVVDLGGLLQLPEVVEVLAWLRLIEDPADNIALARVLQGPRWRIGYRDLVGLARWSAARNRGLREELGEDEHPGDVAFALSEALDNLDDEEMTGVSTEARDRLREFNLLFATLRAAATGPLDELVTAILERSGLWRELEASTSGSAISAKRNLLNFVGSVSSFAPVEGESTLSTLVDYLDAAAEAEEDFEQVQLSDEDTVKLLTIHKAKGLEWDVVFVPGLAEGRRSKIFPDTTRQPNPVTRPQDMPFDVRGDRDVLPQYDGNIKRFREALKERGLEEERRLCYVALTRARDLLVVSSAYWYGDVQDAYQPSMFYEEIVVDPACEELGPRPGCPDVNPLVAARAERATNWPRAIPETGELFPVGDESSLEPPQRAVFDERLRSHLERISLVRSRTASDGRPALPPALSVSSLLTYERCPKMFYWSYVRPLPRRSSVAARVGTEVHRWIELQSRGQGALFDLEAELDLAPDEASTGTGRPGRSVADLKERWKVSRFASTTPLYTERPFLLMVEGFVIGGRIDAVFGESGGAWEVVDYKTGAVADPTDPVAGLQLDVYALACQELWGKRPEDLTLTYAYIGEGEEVSRPASPAAEIRERIAATLQAISSDFTPTPGPQCRSCDFLMACDAGRAWVDANGASSP
jgi:DNA helicase-2/ATP-dependent DNA helicase PcrA